MPKIQQYNLQVFFISKDNDIDELERFITKNKEMLKLYLIIVEDLTPRLKELLEKCGIDYIKPKNQHFGNFGKGKSLDKNTINLSDSKKGESKSDLAHNSMRESTLEFGRESNIDATKNATLLNQNVNQNVKSANPNNIKFFMDLIRSGTEISSDSDIIVFNRVNSGANIKSNKSVFVFGKCDGNIDCRGEYMVLSKIAKGKILFQGIAITQSMLKYKLNLITKDKIGPKITDILAL